MKFSDFTQFEQKSYECDWEDFLKSYPSTKITDIWWGDPHEGEKFDRIGGKILGLGLLLEAAGKTFLCLFCQAEGNTSCSPEFVKEGDLSHLIGSNLLGFEKKATQNEAYFWDIKTSAGTETVRFDGYAESGIASGISLYFYGSGDVGITIFEV